MERDMDLMRKILFTIEKEYKPGKENMLGLNIDGYDQLTVAEHCDLLYQAGLVKSYRPIRGGDSIVAFQVGNLTNHGYDYLELIRNDAVWNKTEKEIEEKKLPKTIESIARIAGIFVGNVIKEQID